jgi:hypothetical protein
MIVEARRHFAEAINNDWVKFNEYYTLMNNSPVYVILIVLNPSHYWQYFKYKWTGERARTWLRDARISVKKFYNENWKDRQLIYIIDEHITVPTNSLSPRFIHDLNLFEQFLTLPIYYNHEPEARVDEYKEYNKLRPAPAENALHWWRDHAQIWPNMTQMAFDLLSIPAMFAKCERVFSQAKLLITIQRNRLGNNIIEAVECLKYWYKVRAFE